MMTDRPAVSGLDAIRCRGKSTSIRRARRYRHIDYDRASVSEPTKRIIRPSEVDIRSVWTNEARDFTPWLAENIEWLSDIGLGPLSVDGVEVAVPDSSRSLDILARTADDRLVAIENQYGRADHDHMTRGLAYAVGHGAHALVVIAERHDSEFRAIADYLNRAFEQMEDGEAIAVFLVSLSVQSVGDGAYVPRFEVVNAPNEWRAEMKASSSTSVAVVESVDAFLETAASDRRDLYTELIAAWKTLPNAFVTRQKTTLGLRIRVPNAGGRVAHRSLYTLERGGIIWVNTRCVADITDSTMEEAGRQILRALESAAAPGNGTWWKLGEADVESMMAFARTLAD